MNACRQKNWNQCFSRRTSLMRRSAVRELLKVAARPDIISFAGGLPAAELFPMAVVQEALTAVLAKVGGDALQYSETEGLAELRDWVAQKYSTERLRIRRENVLITTGSQQALDLIGRVLLDEEDRVIIENPTYLALLSAWRPLGVEFLPGACDADGIQVSLLSQFRKQNPKAIYCMPNFQNPQGTTLSLARRKQLVALARNQSLMVVEDDPYGELRYSGRAQPSLLALDARNNGKADLDTVVVHTSTFSKVMMPGLRVGWVIAPSAVIDKLTQAKQAVDLHTSTLSQHLALTLARQGFLDEFTPELRRQYGRRCQAMQAALRKYFPKSARWTEPEGGMFLFVTLPDAMNASELLPDALAQGVAFVPGEEFHVAGAGRNTLRLNFSNASPERIEEGIRRLGRLLSEHEWVTQKRSS
jgi:2-aminoadipate transaminase